MDISKKSHTGIFAALLALMLCVAGGSVLGLEEKDFKTPPATYTLRSKSLVTATIGGTQYRFEDSSPNDDHYNFKPVDGQLCSGTGRSDGITIRPSSGNNLTATIQNVGFEKNLQGTRGVPVLTCSNDSGVQNITVARANNTQLAAPAATNCNSGNYRECLRNNPIIRGLQWIINFLSAGVAVVIIAMLMFAGIEYITAGSDSAKVENAKKRIQNVIMALLIYIFAFAFLNWLVPGGIFS